MRFLYRNHSLHLENLCPGWHLSARQRGIRLKTAARMHRDILMLDIIVLALGFAFFALAIGYTYACERL
jgi:hypothetical protein